MTSTRTEALAAARDLADDVGAFAVGMCLQQIRQLYDIPAGNPDAHAAWRNARRKHRTTDLASIPAGVPVFWEGGKHGHIAMKAGGDTHDVWTTDFVTAGRLDRVDGRKIGPRWGMQLVGWTEDLNGVTVYTKPKPTPAPAPRPVTKAENRVTRAHQLGRAMLAELDATPRTRAVVHRVADQLRQLLDVLPER